MDEKITKLLDAIADVVDDDSMRYRQKMRLIDQKSKEYERWSIALEEFVAWIHEAAEE